MCLQAPLGHGGLFDFSTPTTQFFQPARYPIDSVYVLVSIFPSSSFLARVSGLTFYLCLFLARTAPPGRLPSPYPALSTLILYTLNLSFTQLP